MIKINLEGFFNVRVDIFLPTSDIKNIDNEPVGVTGLRGGGEVTNC